MKQIKFDEVYKKLQRGELSPYNFYNVDLGLDQIFAVDHYLSHPNDNIERSQKLKKVFFDIEVFTNHRLGQSIQEMVMQGKNLVNSISHFYSSENRFYVYVVPPPGVEVSKNQLEDHINIESNKDVQIGENDDGSPKYGKYFEKGQEAKVEIFKNGVDLVCSFWEKVKEDDPCAISGWNSDLFDCVE